jgi:hypothetical protein
MRISSSFLIYAVIPHLTLPPTSPFFLSFYPVLSNRCQLLPASQDPILNHSFPIILTPFAPSISSRTTSFKIPIKKKSKIKKNPLDVRTRHRSSTCLSLICARSSRGGEVSHRRVLGLPLRGELPKNARECLSLLLRNHMGCHWASRFTSRCQRVTLG